MKTTKRYVVGLTGGIGSGKSAVATIFRRLGIDVVDADQLAREVVEPGQSALEQIASRFGDDILTAAGTLDRAALRALVFSNPQQKTWLENLLHPLIRELLNTRLSESDSAYAVLESPLLLETGQHALVDRVLVVDVEEETQFSRAIARDGSDAETIRSIIASQIDRKNRLERADDVLDNNGSLESLKAAVEALHLKYQKLATEI